MEHKRTYGYIIAGGGILGSSVAAAISENLLKKGITPDIAVLDIDLDGEYSSTLKNAGGVRSTWRNHANIGLCSYSIRFYESIREAIDFKQEGYYWLHNADSWKEILNNKPLYDEYGLQLELCMPGDVSDYLPFVDNTEGISGMSVSRNAGLLDHYSLRQYYRVKAKNAGVEFIDRVHVTGLDISGNSVRGVIARDVSGLIMKKGKQQIANLLKDEETVTDSEEIYFKCDLFINTAGAWSDKITGKLAYGPCTLKPRRRQMELVKCPGLDLRGYGMIIDTSDVYFHGEGENILLGYSNMDEPYGTNFRFDYYSLEDESPFIRNIWIPLWRRISKFEKLKFIRGWSGIYGEIPDRSGYLGKIADMENAYECCAHTGRGIMISYAAGQALSDLVIEGRFRDELSSASGLSRQRPLGPLYEQLHL